jgi:hypothetical protein
MRVPKGRACSSAGGRRNTPRKIRPLRRPLIREELVASRHPMRPKGHPLANTWLGQMGNGGFCRWSQHTASCDSATVIEAGVYGVSRACAGRVSGLCSGPSSPPDGGLPLVGVKVVPPRRCAAAGAPSGLLRRGIGAGRYEEGCRGVVEHERLSGMIFTQPEAGQRSPQPVCGIGAVCVVGR